MLKTNYFNLFVHQIITVYIIEASDSQTLVCIRTLLRDRFLGPNSGVSASIGVGRGWRICTSSKFSGDAAVGVMGAHFENSWFQPWFI